MTTNWGGTYTYLARTHHAPQSIDELRSVVRGTPRLKVVGTGHSFTGIADSPGGDTVTLARMAGEIDIDSGAGTVRVSAGTSYGMLATTLHEHGLALANLASLPHISVAGAIATATHGSGDAVGNLASAVVALELVTASGELIEVSRESAPVDFAGMVVGLGALGIVTRVILAVEPTFLVRQSVWENIGWDAAEAGFDTITGSGYSVSCFTDWGASGIAQVWVKTRADADDDSRGGRVGIPDGRPASGQRHPVPGVDPVNTTEQGDIAGPWFDRLPHFRIGFMPSSGREIQSEYLVARADAVSAFAALREYSPAFASVLQISEIRTIAADDLWLSSSYGRDTVGFHFTWTDDLEGVMRVLPGLEAALQPWSPRPHWGKLFTADAATVMRRYPRGDDFIELARRMDPDGRFRNDFLDTHVYGG